MRLAEFKLPWVCFCALSLALIAGCNGTAVVTLSASPSHFLTYRVGLVAVELKTVDGISSARILPSGTTMDLARLADAGEVLGAAVMPNGKYSEALVTVDYGSAEIIVDDGSLNGMNVTAVDANGQSLGQIQLDLKLDAAGPLHVTSNTVARLALDFNLAASNSVDLTQKTVTVTPLIVANAGAVDDRPVRIRGPLLSADTVKLSFIATVTPFEATAGAPGKFVVNSAAGTAYEIDGTPYAGTAGLSQLAAASAGEMTVAYGTFDASDESFSATRVLAGTSVEGGGLDRITGVVGARAGDTLTVRDAGLHGSDGTDSWVAGVASITVGDATAVTLAAQAGAAVNGPQQISVGSRIVAFGTATTDSAGNVSMDATAGRVRLDDSSASGLVTAQQTGVVTLNLAYLDGRSLAGFDFTGTGTSSGADAAAGQYSAGSGGLDLSNATVGSPLEVSGLVTPFGAAPADFNATALEDSTTLQAQLVIDWGAAGTATPFMALNSADLDLDIHNAGIGQRHQIEIGAQTVDLTGLPADPLIVPDGTATTIVYAIGHASTSSVDNFNTFAAFVAALQSDLNGTTLAYNLTAEGHFSAADGTFTATVISVYLNN
jgi:hypothetical protein